MNELLERYMANLGRSKELIKPTFEPGLAQEALISKVRDIARLQSRLKAENDAILNDKDVGLNVAAEDLTDAQVASLTEFSGALARFSVQKDNGLCYAIHKHLLERARVKNDLDAMIRESYYCGLTLFYLSNTARIYHADLYRQDVYDYFQFAGGYIDKLEEFDSDETKSYILRAMNNTGLIYNISANASDTGPFKRNKKDLEHSLAHHEEVLKVFSDERMHRLIPSMNWDECINSIHFDITTYLVSLREREDKALSEKVYLSASYVYEAALRHAWQTHTEIIPRIQYVYHAARFHKGLIDIDKLLDVFYELFEGLDTASYDANMLFRGISCTLYFDMYYRRYKKKNAADDKRVAYMENGLEKYLRAMPFHDRFSTVISHIPSLMNLYQKRQGSLAQYLLGRMLTFHQPTYVHSVMVSALTRTIMAELLKQNPQLFLDYGCFASMSALEAERSATLQTAYFFGLYHDIGKVAVIDHVSLYGRSLLSDEFEMIKLHCYIGYVTLKAFEQTRVYAPGALGHHLYYDGTRGYPAYYKREKNLAQIIVDVLSVADSLDAATDDIGRSYVKGRDYPSVVEEIKQQAGTRYAPYIAALFDDAAFTEFLEGVLYKWRRAAYFKAYSKLVAE